MENINALVKTVIVISFMWSLAEYIIPQSKLNKYTEFVYGLLIMSVIMTAIFNAKPSEFLPDFEDTYTTEAYTQGYLTDLYEKELENILVDKFSDESIDIELGDDYKITNITCKNQETYQKIMGYLNE